MAESAGPFPEPSPQPPAIRFCTQCGTQLPADARFCVACGASTSPGAAPPGPPPSVPAVPQWAVSQPAQRVVTGGQAATPPMGGAGMVFVRLLQVLSYVYLLLFVIAAIGVWSTPPSYGYGPYYTSTPTGYIILTGLLVLFLGILGWALFQVIASMAENLIALRRKLAP